MKHVRRDNFYYLFFALLLLLFATPISTDLDLIPAPLLRALSFSIVLAIGVWSLQGSRRVFAIGMFLAVAGIIVTVAASIFDRPVLSIGSMVIFIAFLSVAILEALRKVAISNEISTNRLVGAVCVYLMLGLLWAIAYELLFYVSPEAFRLPEDGQDALTAVYWSYYSFITLTTLGYGDILPVSATARALAYAESIIGQLYVAILVAGLVSAYISGRKRSDEL